MESDVMTKRTIMIDPKARSVLTYEIDGSLESIETAVGGVFCVGAVLESGDVMYVDDLGLSKKGIQYFGIGTGRLAGRALLVGPEDRSGYITDGRSTVEEIEKLILFLG